MHKTSYDRMSLLLGRWVPNDSVPREVLDVGSSVANSTRPIGKPIVGGTYRALCPDPWHYTGLDIEPAANVDVVSADPYHWPIETDSVDIVISGQCLEHVPEPWTWIEEVHRVCKPGGLAIIIVPSGGPQHRFPLDCWRIFPDGMNHLLRVSGFQVVETGLDYQGPQHWNDCWGVGRKAARRQITMTHFGRYGRFANQLLEYAFLKCYARKYDLDLQLPPWVGNGLFGCDDPHVNVELPDAAEQRDGDGASQGIPPLGDEFAGCNWHGYAQYNTSWFRPHRDYIRSLFQPVDAVRERLESIWEKFAVTGKTRIGIHLRRGDYGQLHFYITPVRWYIDWLTENWGRFDKPTLFVAAEDRKLVGEFAAYNPVTVEDLGLDLRREPLADYRYLLKDLADQDPHQLDFYPDFWCLSKCDVVLAPNSTYSFVAAMLNPNLLEFWRSHLPTQTFRLTDPWDSDPLERDSLEDWPDIPGTRLEYNPYWKP